MTQLTNGKRACVLVFVPVADILNILCDYQFVFSVSKFVCCFTIGLGSSYRICLFNFVTFFAQIVSSVH